MSKLSEYIKAKRLEQGFTLADVSKVTAIRQQYLEILESGEFDRLPSYVHAHGFLSQYSKVLGLDFKNEIKPMFDEECCKETFGKTQEEIDIEKEHRKNASSQLPFAQIFAGIVVVVIIVAVIMILKSTGFSSKGSASRSAIADNITQMQPVQRAVVPPAALDNTIIEQPPVDNTTAAAAPAVVPPVTAPAVANTAPAASANPEVRRTAVLKFTDSCWVNFQGDGDNATTQDFIAEPGQEKTIGFNKFFRVDVGNASAVTVTYNGKTFSGFGNYRQPVKNLYFIINEEGVMTQSRTEPGV